MCKVCCFGDDGTAERVQPGKSVQKVSPKPMSVSYPGAKGVPKQQSLQSSSTWKPIAFEPHPDDTSDVALPPKYLSMDEMLVQALLDARGEESFDHLANYKTLIVMDEMGRLTGRVRDAIRLTTWTLTALLNAYMVPSRGFFMHHINTSKGILSKQEDKDLEFLIKLLDYEGLGPIKDEIDEYKNFRDEAAFTDLKTEIETLEKNTKLTPDQKTDRAKEKVREMQYSLSPGWNLSKLSMQEWFSFYSEATMNSTVAPINYLGFTISQAIKRAKSDYEATKSGSNVPPPTKIMIFTGAELNPTEFEQIKVLLRSVAGRASEFSITVVYFGDTGITSKENQSRNETLDNMNTREKDIYEAMFLNASHVVEYGPAWPFFLKVLFSHIARIDKMNFRQEEYYGKTKVECSPGNKMTLPTVAQIEQRLGINTADAIAGPKVSRSTDKKDGGTA